MNKHDIEKIMQNFTNVMKPFNDIANTINRFKVDPKTQNFIDQIQKLQINPKIQQLLEQTNLAIANHQKTEPHIENMLSEMETNENLSEAFNTIPYKQLFRLALNNFEVEDLSILKLINEQTFQTAVLNYFEEIEINEKFKERKNIIKEAFKLYELNYFAGCSCLLHSQLEGIITDYLLHKNILREEIENNKTIFIETKNNKNKVNGLCKKIQLAKDINNNFLRLEEYKFESNENKKFHNERNDVLHGSNISNFTAERCFITVVWITSILSSIQKEQLSNSLKRTQIHT